jgi:thiamine-monophosphate kinase
VLRDLGEFALIARIARAARRRRRARVALGIGDDAALLRARRGESGWSRPTRASRTCTSAGAPTRRASVGATAVAAALSDLAAMGARPRGFTCALAAPGDLPLATFDELLRGLSTGARRHACPLVGGNLTRARGDLARAHGVRRRRAPALRCGAARGSAIAILVTGELGAAALARARAEHSGARCAESRCRGSRRAARSRGSPP